LLYGLLFIGNVDNVLRVIINKNGLVIPTLLLRSSAYLSLAAFWHIGFSFRAAITVLILTFDGDI